MKFPTKEEASNAWAVLSVNSVKRMGSLMSPAAASRAYSVFSTFEDAEAVRSCWQASSGRKYQVLPCTITYQLPAKKKK